ncbi:MAG: NAD-binding protein [Oscillochloridaceae bacterium]|nr:NAD-binding protein [Chloroflexaceae bacterium]MDW8390848.1 NAD-binding protein [Oscillochloridaceae bacterium]
MRVLIVGGGQVGSYLAGLLLEEGHAVTIVEMHEATAGALREVLPDATVIHGNGTDPEALEMAGIHATDLVAAVTGTDATNLVITSLARFAFNVPKAVARVNNPHNTWMFIPEMGVDLALNQAEVLARLIAQTML